MVDHLIRGGSVLDGTGEPAQICDIAVLDGRIAAVGALGDVPAKVTFDASGYTVTPGFIDIHRHGDLALFRADFGAAELSQGLTTVVNGNCGLSAAPCFGAHADEIRAYLAPVTGTFPEHAAFSSVFDYLARVRAARPAVNAAILAGGGTIRACVAGYGAGSLDGGQLRAVQTMIERSLADGAVGVSLGLGYAPECFYSEQELTQVLAPLASGSVPVAVHMRQEGAGVLSALEEMLRIAEALDLPVEVSHMKAIGRDAWCKTAPQMLALLRAARARGVQAYGDVYPYTAGATQLCHILPPEAKAGGTAALLARLDDRAERKAVRRRMESGDDFENIYKLVGFENICMTGFCRAENRGFEGKSVAEAATRLGKDPFDCLFDLLTAESCNLGMIDYITCEDDVEALLRDDETSVISDSIYPAEGLCHPRVSGTFSRIIERYVLEKKTLTLPQAVQKMAYLPAKRMNLRRKGLLKVGMDADILIFRPEDVRENATYAAPTKYSGGMKHVLLGGREVLRDGEVLDLHAGRAI